MGHLLVWGQLDPKLSHYFKELLLVEVDILCVPSKLVFDFVFIVRSTSVGRQEFAANAAKHLILCVCDGRWLYESTLLRPTSCTALSLRFLAELAQVH